jgi:DNA-binding response OmpR family regulator
MLRVLIVGGDGAKAAALRRELRDHGYGVVSARTAALGARLAPGVDLAILALDPEGANGVDGLSALLDRIDRRVPVMVVPERTAPRGAEAPALERVSRCVFGDVEVDFLRYQAARAGEPLDLSPREFEILRYLVERRDRVVSREELLRGVWGNQGANLTRTVDVHIAKLRRKVGDDPHAPTVILTVHRAGYRFVG